MARFALSALLLLGLAGSAFAQGCAPSTGIISMVQMDPSCAPGAAVAVQECLSKVQLSTAASCAVTLQPELRIAADGTFCEVSQGIQNKNVVAGRWNMGRSDLEFYLTQRPSSGGFLQMAFKGRVVRPAGGIEPQVDCVMVYNVTGGVAAGVYSRSSDALMGTTVSPQLAAAYAAGALSGGAGAATTQGAGQLTAESAKASGAAALVLARPLAGALLAAALLAMLVL